MGWNPLWSAWIWLVNTAVCDFAVKLRILGNNDGWMLIHGTYLVDVRRRPPVWFDIVNNKQDFWPILDHFFECCLESGTGAARRKHEFQNHLTHKSHLVQPHPYQLVLSCRHHLFYRVPERGYVAPVGTLDTNRFACGLFRIPWRHPCLRRRPLLRVWRRPTHLRVWRRPTHLFALSVDAIECCSRRFVI